MEKRATLGLKSNSRNFTSTSRLSPRQSTRDQVFEAAGGVVRDDRPRSNRRAERPGRNRPPATEQYRNSVTQQDRASAKGEILSQSQVTKKIGSALIKARGNPMAAGAKLMADKEIWRSNFNLLKKYWMPLFWAVVGDACDLIPVVGFVLNWICIVFVSLAFSSKGINFVGKATKGTLSIFNILAEFLISPFLFWPGLVIGTFQTIAKAEKEESKQDSSMGRREDQRRR